jgi:hypothetical protein
MPQDIIFFSPNIGLLFVALAGVLDLCLEILCFQKLKKSTNLKSMQPLPHTNKKIDLLTTYY